MTEQVEPNIEPPLDIILSNVRCASCGDRLILEGIAEKESHYQFDNALWMCFHGGYGMFVDNVGGEDSSEYNPTGCHPDYAAVLCHACAHDLCDKVPWIGNLLRPLNSHAHTYYRDWTGHIGWDLPHKQ